MIKIKWKLEPSSTKLIYEENKSDAYNSKRGCPSRSIEAKINLYPQPQAKEISNRYYISGYIWKKKRKMFTHESLKMIMSCEKQEKGELIQ